MVVDSTGYRVKFIAPDGSVAQVVERPIAPLPVTASMREAEMNRRADRRGSGSGDDNQVVVVPGSSAIRLSREQVDAIVSEVMDAQLAQTTFGPEVPVVAALAVDREDRIWLQRTASDGAPNGPTDVLAGTGEYLGTLMADDFALPLAFGPDGLMAYAETDQHGAPLVRVVRLLALR